MERNPEHIAQPQRVLRVIASKHTRKEDGLVFLTYKAVANPKGKLMTLKFTKACGFPALALSEKGINRFVLVEPNYNVDFNNLYPTIWITGYEHYDTNFEQYQDVLTIKRY